jgi:hemerythrin-like domain-containing protein
LQVELSRDILIIYILTASKREISANTMPRRHDPIAVLNHEHKFIKMVVSALGQLAPSADRAEQADPDTLREIVRFMREFADRCHHAKEEDLLFPAMEEKGVPESGCPLGALRREHEQGRALVAKLAEETERLAARERDAGTAIVNTVGELTELYTNHIWKEDEMVFPMVDRLFSEEERTALFGRFEKAEEEIGADHETLAAFAEELDRKAAAG